MANYINRGGKGKGNSDKKYGKSFNDGGFKRGATTRPAMHKATCTECNSPCEVPFKPNGSKPVLCNSCFRNSLEEGGAAPRKFDREYSKPAFKSFSAPASRGSDNYKQDFEKLNKKLDTIIKTLEALMEQSVDDVEGEE